VLLRLADPDEHYAAVRLCSDLPLPDAARAYARRDGEWRLELPPPPVARLEYQVEVVHRDGGTERLCDPGNPHRAPGAFGEKSVLLLPGYAPPGWLAREGVPGHTHDLTVRGRGLGATIAISLWSPEDADPSEPLPLLVAHDGPEYDELAALTRFAAVAIRAGELPRHRVALLAPGERDEWYSASARYADAMVKDVLPAIGAAVSVRGAPAGMGTSLGALAMLHAQRRFPGAFAGLFLQSGSFFRPRSDRQESGYAYFQRITRFTGPVVASAFAAHPVPVVLTCGTVEENLGNNREMERALLRQGYPAELYEVPDGHHFTAWRDAFDPPLTGLLRRVWPYA
jgi:enterochelin esterase family protein